MTDQNSDSIWRDRPVIIYDRCVSIDDPLLAERLLACRDYAADQGCPVLREHIDYGKAATADGIDTAEWPAFAVARPALRAAVKRATEIGAWLLVWHPDRLSIYQGCRQMVLNSVNGRVLRMGRGRVVERRFTTLPADENPRCKIRITWQIDEVDGVRPIHPQFTYDERPDAMAASSYAIALLSGMVPHGGAGGDVDRGCPHPASRANCLAPGRLRREGAGKCSRILERAGIRVPPGHGCPSSAAQRSGDGRLSDHLPTSLLGGVIAPSACQTAHYE